MNSGLLNVGSGQIVTNFPTARRASCPTQSGDDQCDDDNSDDEEKTLKNALKSFKKLENARFTIKIVNNIANENDSMMQEYKMQESK